MSTTVAKNLYGLYQNGVVLTNISDNAETLVKFACPNDGIYLINTSSPDVASDPVETELDNLSNFCVIENDPDGNYGFSECYQKENGDYSLTMWKHRMNRELIQQDVDEAIEDLTENSGFWNDFPAAVDAVNSHCEFWHHDKIDQKPLAFHLSSKMLQMLLTTGFESDMILVAY